MYNNLFAEMARNRIRRKDIADCIGVGEKTLRNYLNGISEISWNDAVKIRNTFFPGLDMEYLFKTFENEK